MNPDNHSHGGDVPDQPLNSGAPAPTTPTPATDQPTHHQAAATNVLRHQISTLYDKSTTAPVAPESREQSLEVANPYERTHNPHPLPEAEQWKAYHTAWQQYYQKYYEQYYTQQTQAVTQQQPASGLTTGEAKEAIGSQTNAPEPDTIEKDEALYELRQKLLGKVHTSASKLRKSRHFVPILAAVIVFVGLVFVQYNRVLISNVQAYVSPGSVDPQNIVIDPGADVVVGQDPRLIIPKINVDVPVLYDVGTDNDSQMAAMEKGVAHFPIPGANSHPGEVGNTVIAGHSSNDLFDPGDYKFIFAQLEKLAVGDTIYANYEGKRYTYVITKTEVVRPNEVNKLIYPTDKPVMTLITCTPLGTALNRLLVTAEQVSPDPGQASAAPSSSTSETAAIPGNSPTFFERLFGAN